MSNAAPESINDDENASLEEAVSNIFTTFFGIILIGVTTSLLLLCVFAFYHTVEGTPWPESGWVNLLKFGLIVSAISAVTIIIIASVRQAKNYIDKGFDSWIDETAKLAIGQHTVSFIFLIEMFSSPF